MNLKEVIEDLLDTYAANPAVKSTGYGEREAYDSGVYAETQFPRDCGFQSFVVCMGTTKWLMQLKFHRMPFLKF